MRIQWACLGQAPRTGKRISGARFTLPWSSQICGTVQVNHLQIWKLGNLPLRTDGLPNTTGQSKDSPHKWSSRSHQTSREPLSQSSWWKPSHWGWKRRKCKETEVGQRQRVKDHRVQPPCCPWVGESLGAPRKPSRVRSGWQRETAVHRDTGAVLSQLRAAHTRFQSAELSGFNFLIKKEKNCQNAWYSNGK